MLTVRDIRYRINKAKYRMVITDRDNSSQVEEICTECPTLTTRLPADGELNGRASFTCEFLCPAPVSQRPVSIPDNIRTKSTDPMLVCFSPETAGEPKMVLHNHGDPPGHIVTARLLQDDRHNDLHFTVSDNGWARCAWGTIFSQWIEGACIFVYHFT